MGLNLRTVLMSLGVLGLGLHPVAAQSTLPFQPVKKEFTVPGEGGIGLAADGAFADVVQATHQALPDASPTNALEAGLQAHIRKQAGSGPAGGVDIVQAPAAEMPPNPNVLPAKLPVTPALAVPVASPPVPQPEPAVGTAPTIADADPIAPAQSSAAAALTANEQSSAWATAYLPQTGSAALPQAAPIAPPFETPAEAVPVETVREAVAALPQVQEPAVPEQPEPETSAPEAAVAAAGSISEKARDCMATAVYFEARKQSEDIQRAVVQVILNRVASGLYPKDICETVFQDQYVQGGCQFVFTCDGRSEIIRDQEAWQKALEAVELVTSGQAWSDTVAGATHYHAPDASPEWVADVKEVGALDGYSFYRKS